MRARGKGDEELLTVYIESEDTVSITFSCAILR